MFGPIFQVRKDGFKDNPSVPDELDLVEEDDQFTHMIMLEEATGGEEILNVFKFDPEYAANEEKYKSIKKELLDESSSSGSGSSSSSSSGSDSDDDEAENGEAKDEDKELAAPILDTTETNLIALRRTIYLTIQSSLDFEEAVHKLMKMNLKPGHEPELCHMILDCCAQQRTYEKFFGLMAQRFCQINKTYVEPFQAVFDSTYSTVHRLEIGKLRNVGKLFAHLLFTDAISWEVISCIRLNEEETTSSSRIFIKILFQELAEYMGITKLNERLRDPTLAEAFDGLLPRDDPQNTRFAVNFFTSIGLGSLTEDLRAHLKNQPQKKRTIVPEEDDSSSSSSSASTDSEEERRRRKKKEKKRKKKEEKKRKKEKRRREESDEEEDRDRGRRRNDSRERRERSRDRRRDRSEERERRRDESEEIDRRRDKSEERARRRDKSEERGRRRDKSKERVRRRDKSEESDRSKERPRDERSKRRRHDGDEEDRGRDRRRRRHESEEDRDRSRGRGGRHDSDDEENRDRTGRMREKRRR